MKIDVLVILFYPRLKIKVNFISKSMHVSQSPLDSRFLLHSLLPTTRLRKKAKETKAILKKVNDDFVAFWPFRSTKGHMGIMVKAHKAPPDGLASLMPRVQVKNGVFGKSGTAWKKKEETFLA